MENKTGKKPDEVSIERRREKKDWDATHKAFHRLQWKEDEISEDKATNEVARTEHLQGLVNGLFIQDVLGDVRVIALPN